ncbi:MAG: D-alanine--D-alanine ligase family protein [bacterium]|nr:D-alanine--D-alanine ligase family protein [bacterium]
MVLEKNKMTIGVFFGSRSPEHEVSIITGQLIISELRKLGYHVVPVYIDKKGQWFCNPLLGSLKFFTEGNLDEKLSRLSRFSVDTGSENQTLVLKTGGVFSKDIVINMAFPALHGMNGEDGTIQGIFELVNVPYVGCGVASSALTMDKAFTKRLLQSENIATTPFIHFTVDDWQKDKAAIVTATKKLHWPVFVKPARLGSSIAMDKVRTEEELENACEVALHYDTKVIVEESVENLMDITCAVLGNDEPIASLIQESLFAGEHFSYSDKYLEDGGAQLGNAENKIVIPARLSEERTREVRDLAVKIFKLADCAGIARVDFLYDKVADKIYANEINTLPGTLYHHLWKASGIEIGVLLEKLLELAKEQHAKKNAITMTFKSDLLSFANSVKLQMGKEKE